MQVRRLQVVSGRGNRAVSASVGSFPPSSSPRNLMITQSRARPDATGDICFLNVPTSVQGAEILSFLCYNLLNTYFGRGCFVFFADRHSYLNSAPSLATAAPIRLELKRQSQQCRMMSNTDQSSQTRFAVIPSRVLARGTTIMDLKYSSVREMMFWATNMHDTRHGMAY